MWIPQIILYLIYSTQAFTKQYIFVPTGGHLVSSETSRQHWEMDIPTSCTLPGHQAGHPPWELEKERQLSQGIFKTFCFLLRVSFSNNFCQFSLLPWKTVMLCVWKVQPLWFNTLADSQKNFWEGKTKERETFLPHTASITFCSIPLKEVSFLAQRSSKKKLNFCSSFDKMPPLCKLTWEQTISGQLSQKPPIVFPSLTFLWSTKLWTQTLSGRFWKAS